MTAAGRLRRLARRVVRGAAAGSEVAAHRAFLRGTAGYDGAYFNLTVDFELAWSIARRGDGANLEDVPERARRARAALPALLDLCDAHGVPLTFAVVGHLALEDCSHADPPPYAPSWIGGDWYAADPRSSIAADRDRYAADLVREIRDRSARHELAGHGFTHVDLGDPETPPEVARYELVEARAALARLEPDLRTHVFPKNHVAHLDLVREAGFSIYRAARDVRVERDGAGLWAFPRGLWLAPSAVTPGDVLAVVDDAVRHRQLSSWFFHLYEFADGPELTAFLEPVFARLARERENGDVQVMTMRGIVDAVGRQ